MFYSASIKYSEKGMSYYCVGLVYADCPKNAMKKVFVLYQNFQITEVKLRELPDEFLERIKTSYGGTTIAEFEEYIE